MGVSPSTIGVPGIGFKPSGLAESPLSAEPSCEGVVALSYPDTKRVWEEGFTQLTALGDMQSIPAVDRAGAVTCMVGNRGKEFMLACAQLSFSLRVMSHSVLCLPT